MHGLGDKRRADLLLIRISDEEVVLVPIEIKYYGMDTPTSLLPAAGAAALEEPLEQLASSARVMAGLSESGQGSLWSAAFASLVEVGLRLNPRAINDRGWAADRLAQIAMGRVPVRVGHPLLTYFKHGSGTYRATADAPSQVLDIDHHGQFVADPGCVARALFSGGKGSGRSPLRLERLGRLGLWLAQLTCQRRGPRGPLGHEFRLGEDARRDPGVGQMVAMPNRPGHPTRLSRRSRTRHRSARGARCCSLTRTRPGGQWT